MSAIILTDLDLEAQDLIIRALREELALGEEKDFALGVCSRKKFLLFDSLNRKKFLMFEFRADRIIDFVVQAIFEVVHRIYLRHVYRGSGLLTKIFTLYAERAHLRSLQKTVSQQLSKLDVNEIYILVTSSLTFRLALKMLNKTNQTIHPVILADIHEFYPFVTKRNFSVFEKLLQKSHPQIPKKLYSKLEIEKAKMNPNPKMNQERDPFIIGITGRRHSLSLLVRTLESNNWKIGDFSVKLHYWGGPDEALAIKNSHIRWMGKFLYEATVEEISDVSFFYIQNLFLNQRSTRLMERFNPNLMRFFECRCKVFYHGPSYTLDSYTISHYFNGYTCFSQNPKSLMLGIRKAALGIQSLAPGLEIETAQINPRFIGMCDL